MRAARAWALGLVALVGAAAGAALAQETVPRYRRTLVTGKLMCVAWSGRELVYRLDRAGSARTPGDTERAAIDAAFETWNAAAEGCSDFRLRRGEDLDGAQVGFDRQNLDQNQNVLVFREQDCDDVVPVESECSTDVACANAHACWAYGDATIAITTVMFNARTGALLDADIEFNASAGASQGFLFTTVPSPPCGAERATDCVSTDLQNTLTHELGHAVGLDHVPVTGSTMEATAPPGETHKRALDLGTRAGLCAAYPRGLPSTHCTAGAEPEGYAIRHAGGCAATAGGGAGAAALLLLLALARAPRRRTGGEGG